MKNSGPGGPAVHSSTPGANSSVHPGASIAQVPAQPVRLAQPARPVWPAHPVGYLTIHGAAQYASVSTKTLRRWITSGLPVHQGTTRGKVLIRPADIDAYLTRRQVPVLDLNALVNDTLRGMKRAA